MGDTSWGFTILRSKQSINATLSTSSKINKRYISKLVKWQRYEKTKKSFWNLIKANKENLLYKAGNPKKDRVYDFWKYKTLWSFGIVISNGTTTLENAYSDQVYLK